MRNKQMVIKHMPNFTLFKISPTHACKMTPFSWFREFTPPIEKNTPFFTKMGTSVVNILVGSWGPGWNDAQSLT